MTLYGFNSSIIFNLLSVPAVTPGTYSFAPNSDGVMVATWTPDKNINNWYAYSSVQTQPVANSQINSATAMFGSINIPQVCQSVNKDFPDWLSTTNTNLDLRGFYQSCCDITSTSPAGYCPRFTWPNQDQVLGDISPVSGNPIAFTTETIFYAQSGYFVTVVMVQWSNVFACKSRKVVSPSYRFH